MAGVISPPSTASELRDLLRCRGVPSQVVGHLVKKQVDCEAFLSLDDEALESRFDIEDADSRKQLLRCQRLLRDHGPEAFAHECYTEAMTTVAEKLEAFYLKNGVLEKRGKALSIVVSYGDDPKLLLDALMAKYEAKTKELSFLKDWVKDHERRQKRMQDLQKKLEAYLKRAGDPVAAGKASAMMQSYCDAPGELKKELQARWPRGGDAGWCDGWADEVDREQGWKRRRDEEEAKQLAAAHAEGRKAALKDAESALAAVSDQQRKSFGDIIAAAAASAKAAAEAEAKRLLKEQAAREEEKRKKDAAACAAMEKAETGKRKDEASVLQAAMKELYAAAKKDRADILEKEERERQSAEERKKRTQQREGSQRKGVEEEEKDGRSALSALAEEKAEEARQRTEERLSAEAAARLAVEEEATTQRAGCGDDELAAREAMMRAEGAEGGAIRKREDEHRQMQADEREAVQREESQGRDEMLVEHSAEALAVFGEERRLREEQLALEQRLREERDAVQREEEYDRGSRQAEEDRVWGGLSQYVRLKLCAILLRCAAEQCDDTSVRLRVDEQLGWERLMAADEEQRRRARWEEEARAWRGAEARGFVARDESAGRATVAGVESEDWAALMNVAAPGKGRAAALERERAAEDAILRELEDIAVEQRQREQMQRAQWRSRSEEMRVHREDKVQLWGGEAAGRSSIEWQEADRRNGLRVTLRTTMPAPPEPDWRSVDLSQVAGLREDEQKEWRKALSEPRSPLLSPRERTSARRRTPVAGERPPRAQRAARSRGESRGELSEEDALLRSHLQQQRMRLQRMEALLRLQQGSMMTQGELLASIREYPRDHPSAGQSDRTDCTLGRPVETEGTDSFTSSRTSSSAAGSGSEEEVSVETPDLPAPVAPVQRAALTTDRALEQAEAERAELWESVAEAVSVLRKDVQGLREDVRLSWLEARGEVSRVLEDAGQLHGELAAARSRLGEAEALCEVSARLAVLLCRVLADAPSADDRKGRRVRFHNPQQVPHRRIRTPSTAVGAADAAELAAWCARQLAGAGLLVASPADAGMLARWLLEGASSVLSQFPASSSTALLDALKASCNDGDAFGSRFRALSGLCRNLPSTEPPQSLTASVPAFWPARWTGSPPRCCRSASPWSADSTFGAGRLSP